MKELLLYIRAIPLSLFSKEFYYELIVDHKIYGFLYLLFLSFLISVPISYQVKSSLNGFIGVESADSIQEVDDNIEYIASQIPELKIKNNKLSSGDNSPLIVSSKTDKPIFVFDTSDTINDLDSYNNVIVFTSDKFLFLFNDMSAAISLADALPELTQYLTSYEGYTDFDLRSLFLDMKGVFVFPVVFFVIGCTIWFFIRYGLKAFAFSFFAGFLINLMLRTRKFTFRAFLRISSFAITIVFVLEFLSLALGQQIFSNPVLVYFVAHLIYIYYAVDAYKQLSFKK